MQLVIGGLIFRHQVRVSLLYADIAHPSKKSQGLSTVPWEDLREQNKGERESKPSLFSKVSTLHSNTNP